MAETFSVVVVGAGPIGERIAALIAQRPTLRLHAVVDVDPAKLGREVAGVRVTNTMPAAGAAHVAVLTTTSSLERLTPQIDLATERGFAVVSTCEELSWPYADAELAKHIDALARTRNVCVLGTGVNPGFLMDALPLALTAPCERVTRVVVERVQDASLRRRPFQDKVGVGMRPDDVTPKLDAGAMGHVGLRESASLLATKLGLARASDAFVERRRVVVATESIERHGRRVDAGQVIGVEQIGTLGAIELVFRAVFGEPAPRDRITIEGTPRLVVDIEGGVPGDVATAAIVVNAIPIVARAQPGLATMADLPIVFCQP